MKKNSIALALSLCLLLNANAQSDYLTSFDRDGEGTLSTSVNSGGKLFFSAYDNMHGRELWVTDGTASGTHIVKDINPGIGGSMTISFNYAAIDFNGILFFKANDGTNGPGLWRSDGTEAGTWLVNDLYIDTYDYGIGDFAATDSVLYFVAKGNTVWRTNGTYAETRPVAYFQIARNLATYKNNLYFSAAIDNTGEELWRTNGRTDQTSLLKDLNGVIGASLPCNFFATGNALYFTANTSNGWELWKTTGTSTSTQVVKDINPTGDGVLTTYSEKTFSNIGNTIYFAANDGVSGYQLWKSDGTEAGTLKLSNLAEGVYYGCDFPVVNNKVLFFAYSSTNYWQYDPATNLVAETDYPYIRYFLGNTSRASFVGSNLYFTGTDSSFGSEMWLSDGTDAGTRRIQETYLVNNYDVTLYAPSNSIVGIAGNKLLFSDGRSATDFKKPLYAYNMQLNNQTAFAPSTIIPVTLPDNKMHLVWNRIDNAEKYRIQYRAAGSGNPLNTVDAPLSFAEFSLNANTEYLFRIRTMVNGSWTTWSKPISYKTSETIQAIELNFLADRAEDATAMRLYWLKSNDIEKMQIRYRPVGTTDWLTKQNNSGFMRITGLTPSALYEYEFRLFSSGFWGQWSFGRLCFATPAATLNNAVAKNENKQDALSLVMAPNPAKGVIHIKNKLPDNAYFAVTDASGNILKTGVVNASQIDLSGLKKGMLTIIIQKDNFRASGKVLLQ